MKHRFEMLTLFACLVVGLLTVPSRAEWIWVEGEKPVKQSMHRHPWYDQVKKDQFCGGDFISNFSDKARGEATYEFKAAKAAQSEFWVRANPVQSAMSYRLNAGDWTRIVTDKD